MTGERQVPFFCPYCGDESLRPDGPQAGDWECGACARSFRLSFVAVSQPGHGAADLAEPAGPGDTIGPGDAVGQPPGMLAGAGP